MAVQLGAATRNPGFVDLIGHRDLATDLLIGRRVLDVAFIGHRLAEARL